MRTRPALAPLLSLLAASLLAGCAPGGDAGEVDDAAEDGKADGLTANAKVVYLNFGGGTIAHGDCNDATASCSSMVLYDQTPIPAFDASPYGARSTIVNKIVADVRRYYAGLDVRFTTTRPASGDYRMVMIGGKSLDSLGVWVLGRSYLDCGGGNGRAIAFVAPKHDSRPTPDASFDLLAPYDPLSGFRPAPEIQEWDEPLTEIPRAIAHELGHTFGLIHTVGFSASNPSPADIMCEEAACRSESAFSFHDREMGVDAGQGHCDDSGVQSSLGLLQIAIGVAK